MRRRRPLSRLVLAVALLASAGPLLAAQDLMQTWRAALARDPIYSAARAAYRAAQEVLPQTRAGLLPSATANLGGIYHENRSTHGMRRADSGRRGTWELVLEQPIFDWSAWQTYERAKVLVADADVNLALAYQDLLLRTAQAYFDVLAAQDTLSALEAEKAAVAEQLASARRNFELGNATVTDIHEAQARYDLVVADELQAHNDLEVARDALSRLIGEPPVELARLPYDVALPAPNPNRLEAWSAQAETSGLEVVRAQLATRIAEYGIDIARGGHYPTLSLTASSGSASDSAFEEARRGRPVDNRVGLQLSIPLYAGGGVSSRVTEAVERVQQARHEYENARRQAIQQARRYFTGVNTGLARIRALEAGEKSSRAAVAANRTGYEVGVRINLDVLNAQQQLYATLRDLARARYETVMAGLRLRATAGILSEVDLENINQLLREPGQGGPSPFTVPAPAGPEAAVAPAPAGAYTPPAAAPPSNARSRMEAPLRGLPGR